MFELLYLIFIEVPLRIAAAFKIERAIDTISEKERRKRRKKK